MSFARGLVLPQKSPQVARGSPEAPNREVYQVRSCNLEANGALLFERRQKRSPRVLRFQPIEIHTHVWCGCSSVQSPPTHAGGHMWSQVLPTIAPASSSIPDGGQEPPPHPKSFGSETRPPF